MISGCVLTNGKLSEINESNISILGKLRKKGKIWVSITDPTKEEIHILTEQFCLHPTQSEDLLNNATRIKYEEYENNTFIVFKGICEIKKTIVDFYTIFIIDGEHFVITLTKEKNETIDYLLKNKKKVESLLAKGEDYIIHYILDKEVDKYLFYKENISEEITLLEENFIRKPSRDIMKELFIKDIVIIEIKNKADSITEICLRLAKPTDNFIDNDLIPYFRDVYDHAIKVSDTLKTFQDRINGIRNSYMSITSNKINESMRLLTIVMALMMPMTIITGAYGMNIKLPLQDHPLVFYLLILVMFITAGTMIFLFTYFGRYRRN